MYASNVVLNVNMFLVDISIATPFSFELISENVSKILGIKWIQTIYLVPIDMSNLLFKAICLKILIPGDDLQDTCRMLSRMLSWSNIRPVEYSTVWSAVLQFISKIVRAYLTFFSMMLKNIPFPFTVSRPTLIWGKDISL